jgi:hypothetical protein
VKEAQINAAKDRVFGPQRNMPGDRFIRRRLEGQELKQMYFPSRFSLQDFRVDEYFEMQAERFAPREVHASIPQLESTLKRIAKNRTKVKDFFETKVKVHTPEGRQTLQENPTLQDLHGLLRHLDAWPQLCALGSSHPDLATKDLEEPPLRLTPKSSLSSRPGSGSTDSSQAQTDPSEDSNRRELAMLATQLRDAMPRGDWMKLEAQMLQLKSAEEVQELLLAAKQQREIVPEYKSLSLVMEDEEVQTDKPAFASKRLSSVLAKTTKGQGDEQKRTQGQEKGEATIDRYLAGQGTITTYLKRRHRFIEPMYRRRRLKWLEKMQANRIKAKDLQLNDYWPVHPDKKEKWPTNMGSVTIKWPSPWH